jgi:UDP-glucose 4-epimerase
MGFIGQATANVLERRGDQVTYFDRTHGNDILGDLSSLKGVDSVIHLAGVLGTAELFDDAENAVLMNVLGALRVIEWCSANDVGYVGITMPPVFPSVYTATKICADRLATAWHHSKGLRVSTVRAFNAYGPGQHHGPGHPQKIIPMFATEAWAGRPIPIWGDGTQTVDLVHVDDVGRMLADAVLYIDNETFDAGTGRSMTVLEVAQFVLDVTGSKAGIQHLPMRAGELPTRIVASGFGWTKLGWQPQHSDDLLAEAIEWYHPDTVHE